MRKIELTVPDTAAGVRLDGWLATAVADLGRNHAKRLIVDGHVAIGGRTIVEPKRPVKPGETVVVEMPPAAPATPQPEAMALDIVYEDDDLIVIHRLDKDTTGLLVVAKNDRAHRGLAEQFADHGRTGPLEREYVALVWGVPSRPAGTIELPLGRSTRNREKIEVKRHGGGREAITHYRVEERYGTLASEVACLLETGRTHQIRVHMAALGHPVIGDRTYGSGFATKTLLLPEPARTIATEFKRQALHARALGFEHPVTGEELYFESALPADMVALSEALAAAAASA